MALKKLPSNGYAVYTFDIPSMNKKFRFRPFLVKESKALMIANGEQDKGIMLNTLKSVIQSACLDPELDVDQLAIFDVEYLLVKLRSVSTSDPIDVLLSCTGDHKDLPPAKEIPVHVDLSKIEVADLNLESKRIQLETDKIVFMKYPDLDILEKLNKPQDEIDFIDIVARCIDYIVIGEEMYQSNEISREDLDMWLDTLDMSCFDKLTKFFENLPYTRLKVEYDCPVCGKHNIQYLVGLQAFF